MKRLSVKFKPLPRIERDGTYAYFMWRVYYLDGTISDMVNKTRASAELANELRRIEREKTNGSGHQPSQ